jgi:hypothetical protein
MCLFSVPFKRKMKNSTGQKSSSQSFGCASNLLRHCLCSARSESPFRAHAQRHRRAQRERAYRGQPCTSPPTPLLAVLIHTGDEVEDCWLAELHWAWEERLLNNAHKPHLNRRLVRGVFDAIIETPVSTFHGPGPKGENDAVVRQSEGC